MPLQLRRVRRTLDDDSIEKFVHDFITSRVDKIASAIQPRLLASAPTKTSTDNLQRVMNAACIHPEIRLRRPTLNLIDVTDLCNAPMVLYNVMGHYKFYI